MNSIIKKFYKIARRIKMETKPWGFTYSYIVFPVKVLIKKMGIGPKFYKDICKLKNKYDGGKCYIIATGPSLSLSDVEMLKGENTIAVNTIFKLFPETDWRPTYYVMTDPNLTDLVINNGTTSFDGFASEYCIFNRINKKKISCKNGIFIENNWLDHVYHYGDSKRFVFNLRPELGVYDLYSVTQESILYAIYMGFKNIYIIGADNDYLGSRKHFSKIEGEPDYRNEQAIKIQRSNDYAYDYLKGKADEMGVKIYNASRGGNINAFPRVRLEQTINK